ncbi:hypothetical protein K7X08_018502 [Anisodus acutangulus]|uniref:Uncharacterized protein n=1 Tax=Anisodus acutangulus TaxID=402998 RepID=A0A9Q1LX32_9SOLA|nr:hypothetical protein K7X08_018502 [Anisodus acutangulus]
MEQISFLGKLSRVFQAFNSVFVVHVVKSSSLYSFIPTLPLYFEFKLERYEGNPSIKPPFVLHFRGDRSPKKNRKKQGVFEFGKQVGFSSRTRGRKGRKSV